MRLSAVVRRRLFAVVAIGAGLLVLPGAALAQASFRDIGGNVHAPSIGWVVSTGITVGCDNRDNFCPNDPVTRDQMATFLHRASGNANGVAPSVNALRLEGLRAADFLRSNGTAANANRLANRPATDYLRSGDTATNSQRLGGRLPAEYVLANAEFLRSVQYRATLPEPWSDSLTTTTSVNCQAGERPIGGGYAAADLSTTLNVTESVPTTNGWRVSGTATPASSVTVHVICGRFS